YTSPSTRQVKVGQCPDELCLSNVLVFQCWCQRRVLYLGYLGNDMVCPVYGLINCGPGRIEEHFICTEIDVYQIGPSTGCEVFDVAAWEVSQSHVGFPVIIRSPQLPIYSAKCRFGR